VGKRFAALQGSFAEHQASKDFGEQEAIEVGTPEELKRCDALIIPGGLPCSLPFFIFHGGPRKYACVLDAQVRVC